MAVELFGPEIGPFAALACVVASVLGTYRHLRATRGTRGTVAAGRIEIGEIRAYKAKRREEQASENAGEK
jgi:hypothetical protein